MERDPSTAPRATESPVDGPTSPSRRQKDLGAWRACAAVLGFGLFLYGDLLFSRSNVVVSHLFGDTCGAFAGWRRFGFGELAQGKLPLWDPYVFCGAPFVGNVQSAMFYPVNAIIYLLLPLANAINAEVMFHLLLAGYSTLAWVRSRGTGWLACAVSAAIAMASAPVCLRLNLGQLNVIAVYAWLPLTLLAIDKLLERVTPGWMLVAIGAISMQLTAGYPPSVYNNAIAVALYTLMRLVSHPRRARTSMALSIVAVMPLFIAAAPLAAGYHTMRESLRAEGTSPDFASSWSLPFENLLTALTPLIYGDYTHVNYWGRWCLWDVCVFIGIGSLCLLSYGALYAPRHARKLAGTMLILLLLTALGRYTPFFTVLYYCVPGISSFRAPSKFLLPAIVFAAMLAGLGADAFLAQPKRSTRFALASAACGACLLSIGAGLMLTPSILDKPNGLWTMLVAAAEHSGEAYWWYEMNDTAMERSVWIAAMSAFAGAITCVVIAYLFYRADRRGFRVALVCLSAAELLLFCRYTRVTVDTDALTCDALAQLRASDAGDYRELQAKSINPNWRRNFPADIHMKTAWGYDPVVLKRYAEFFAFALGGPERQRHLTNDIILTNILDPISIAMMEDFFHFEFEPKGDTDTYPYVNLPPLFRLTRCKYVYFWPEPIDGILHGVEGIYQVRDPFPRFSIYRDYRVAPRDQLLSQMAAPGADIDRVLYLEEGPSPKPDANAPGNSQDDHLELIGESTDDVSVDVQLSAPGLLFITDAYSDGWRATPLPGSAQTEYRILPADYAFQAVPLSAGHHRIRFAYRPEIVLGGMWVSGVSSIAFLCMMGGWWVQYVRSRRANGRRAA